MAKKLTQKNLLELSQEYESVQKEIKTLNSLKTEIKARLFDHFDTVVGKDAEADVELDDGYRFTREARITRTLDASALEQRLAPDAWKSITLVRREVDEKKLKAAMSKGKVSEDDVRDCMVTSKIFTFNHRKTQI